MTSPPEHRLLGVFAHPDDETIGAGSLLALAVRAGVDVSVVTCTRGERGEVIPPELAHLSPDPDGLARHREGELSGALAELGVHRHLFLDQVPGLTRQRPDRFRDSGMRWVRPGVAGPGEDAGADAFTAVDVEVAARLLAVVIRHVRPTAVLTEEPGGGYGHPDHVHAHRVTMRAIEMAAAADPTADDGLDPLVGLAPWSVPTVLWVAQEETHLRSALTELAATLGRHEPLRAPDGTVLTVPDPAAELPGVAAPADAVVASFDVRPVAERVLAALRRHRSQVQAVAPIDGRRLVGHLALSNATLMPVLDRAYLRAAPGSDATTLVAALSARTGPEGSASAGHPAPVGAGGPDGGALAGGSASVGAGGPDGGQDAASSAPVGAGGPDGGQGAASTASVGATGSDGGPHAPAPAFVRSGVRHGGAGAGTPDSVGMGGPDGGARAGGSVRTSLAASADHAAAARAAAAQEAATRSVLHPMVPADDAAPNRPRRRRGPLARLVTSGGAVGVVVAVLAGLVMGMLGTVVHRYTVEDWPVGIALGLAGVLAAAVAARAVAGGGGLVLAVLSVIVITQAMAFLRPGGDVLVTSEPVSYVWLFGAPLMAVAAGLLPRRWFADGGGRRT